MTENKVQFRQEGDLAFPIVEKEKKEEPAAPAEEAPAAEVAPVAEKVLPFNEDPKVQEYIQRQVTKGIEEAAKNGPAAKQEAIDAERERNAAETKIPAWFGGNQAQWDEYRTWLDGRLQKLGEQTVAKTFETAKTQDSEAKKAQQEATEHFNSELKAITADKTLNPTGKAIDPNKLLKAAIDNELVDTKGRWNYRAAVRFLNGHTAASHAAKPDPKKDLAGATMEGAGGSGGEQKPKNFKTPADFRKKRPW